MYGNNDFIASMWRNCNYLNCPFVICFHLWFSIILLLCYMGFIRMCFQLNNAKLFSLVLHQSIHTPIGKSKIIRTFAAELIVQQQKSHDGAT